MVLASLMLLLGGCNGLDKRYGLSPVLDVASVEASSAARGRILDAFAADAGAPPNHPDYWNLVALAGFNYVDDECRSYFQQLFFLNRERDRIKGGLGSASAATAAILSATGATATSLAVVAQAFGLGMAATDIVAGAYLYQLPPAVTQGFVREMQLAYREGAAARRALIASAPAAYQAIQGYLELCLPPTIEAKIAEHVSSARAVPDPASRARGSTFGINIIAVPPASRTELLDATGDRGPAVRDPAIGAAPMARDRVRRQPEEPGVRETTLAPGIEDILDKSIVSRGTIDYLKRLQASLCVPADEIGAVGSATRALIEIYEQTQYPRTPAQRDGKLLDADIVRLQGGCAPGGPRNYFEKTTFTDSADGDRRVKLLVEGLNRTDAGAPIAADSSLEQARAKIEAVRRSPAIAAKLLVRLPPGLPGHVTRDLLSALPR
jgi:hypothetical protein